MNKNLENTDYIKDIESKKNIEIKTRNESIIKLEKKVNELKITNNQEFGLSNDLLKKIKDVIKLTESFKKELIAPMNQKIKEIRDSFKPISEKANKIKEILEDKIKEYNKILEKRAREKLEKEKKLKESVSSFLDDDDNEIVEKKIESIDNQIEIKKAAPIEIKSSFSTGKTQTVIIKKWTYEIENPFGVPPEYCSPDHNKIMDAIKLGIRNIPGLRIFDKGSVRSREAK